MLIDRWERIVADGPRPEQRQSWVPWNQINPAVPLAIVAAEDRSFRSITGLIFQP